MLDRLHGFGKIRFNLCAGFKKNIFVIFWTIFMQNYMNTYMNLAISEANKSADAQEVPVGAVLVYKNSQHAEEGFIIFASHNKVICNSDPTAHAEIVVIRQACERFGTHILEGCDLFVTLEPCAMCAQAISYARITRLYFGAYDKKCGGVDHGGRIFTHSCYKPYVIGGVFETQCAEILQNFFVNRRF